VNVARHARHGARRNSTLREFVTQIGVVIRAAEWIAVSPLPFGRMSSPRSIFGLKFNSFGSTLASLPRSADQ